MTNPGINGLDPLHYQLLGYLAARPDCLTTAELRDLAERHQAGFHVPLVIETVYRTLRTLHRLGQVSHHRPGGRHVSWAITPSGRHTSDRRTAGAEAATLPKPQTDLPADTA